MSRLNIARFINGHKPALDALSKVNSNLCVLQEYRRKQIFRTHSTRDRKVDPFEVLGFKEFRCQASSTVNY